MAFTIDEAFLSAILNAPPMTDQQFADFCEEHPDLFFEMTAEGELIVRPPTLQANYAQCAASDERFVSAVREPQLDLTIRFRVRCTGRCRH